MAELPLEPMYSKAILLAKVCLSSLVIARTMALTLGGKGNRMSRGSVDHREHAVGGECLLYEPETQGKVKRCKGKILDD